MTNQLSEDSIERSIDEAFETKQTILRNVCAQLRSIVQTVEQHHLTNSTQSAKILKVPLDDGANEYRWNDPNRNFIRVVVPRESAPESVSNKLIISRGSIALARYEEFTLSEEPSLLNGNSSLMRASYTKRNHQLALIEHRKSEHGKEIGINMDDMQVLVEWVKELEQLTGERND